MRISGLVATRGGEQAATAFPQTPPTFLYFLYSWGRAICHSIPANTPNLFTLSLSLFYIFLHFHFSRGGEQAATAFPQTPLTFLHNFHCSISIWTNIFLQFGQKLSILWQIHLDKYMLCISSNTFLHIQKTSIVPS